MTPINIRMIDEYAKLYKLRRPSRTQLRQSPTTKSEWQHYGWVCRACCQQFYASITFADHETRCSRRHGKATVKNYRARQREIQQFIGQYTNHANTTNTKKQ